MDEMDKLEAITDGLVVYFKALRAGDILEILEARATLARLIEYTGPTENENE